MAKILLDVITRENHNDDDILVYDAKRGVYVETPKSDFLKQEYAKISELELNIDNLNGKIVKMNESLSKMAKIIKERVI